MSNRYSIYSDKAESFFHVFPGGRVVWENGSATCTACGCEVSSGKRNDEPAEELRARLGGKRARVKGGVLPCAGCGEEYPIRAEKEPVAIPDIRPTLRAAIAARYGTGEGAYTALARDLAPRWGCTVASAKQRLSRFFSEDEQQFRDMTSRPLAVLLDVIGVDLVMRGAP